MLLLLLKDWVPPPVRILKLNFDGVSKGNPGLVGFGCVIWNHYSIIIKSCCGPLGLCGSIEAEARALLVGLRELKNLGASSCIAEGNSQTIISWGLGNSDFSWQLAPVIYEIRELIFLMNGSLVHVVRSQNGLVADQLANWRIAHGVVHCESCLPGDLLSTVF